MKQKINITIRLFIIFILSSCSHIHNKNDNISSVENKTKAAVISGCSYDYLSKFIVTADSKQPCITTWKNIETGDQFSTSGYDSINFIAPGIYEFIGYKSKLTNRSSYTKRPKALSVFSKLNIKGGDVVYIGHLNVNSKKTVSVLDSMSFYQNKEEAIKYLQSVYPTLVNKINYTPITFSKEAQMVKDVMNKIDGEKNEYKNK